MNRRLQDPFQLVGLPEVIEEYLEHGAARCLAFNRRGTLLASGTDSGDVVIWDFETRGVAKVLSGHAGAVSGVCWSRDGRRLASAGADGRLILWDVLAGSTAAEARLPGHIAAVSLSPRAPYKAAVTLASGPPQLVQFPAAAAAATAVEGASKPTAAAAASKAAAAAPSAAAATIRQLAWALPGDPAPAELPQRGGRGGIGSGGASDGAGAGCMAVFTAAGDAVIVANPKGGVVVQDAETLALMDAVRIAGSPKVSSVSLSRKGSHLLLNCADRSIRMFELALPPVGAPGRMVDSEAAAAAASAAAGVKAGSLLRSAAAADGAGTGASVAAAGSTSAAIGPMLRPAREFSNAVERTPWRAACFSHDTEHVVAASSGKEVHHLYLWSAVVGQLACILEGPKEAAVALAWHPGRSILASAAASGRIYLWAKIYQENWSAFAPDFQELDENQEYVEREDEFDLNPREDEATPAAAASAAAGANSTGAAGDGCEPDVVDVMGANGGEGVSAWSSDEEEDELRYLPVEIEPGKSSASGDDSESSGSASDEAAADAPAGKAKGGGGGGGSRATGGKSKSGGKSGEGDGGDGGDGSDGGDVVVSGPRKRKPAAKVQAERQAAEQAAKIRRRR